MSTQDEVAELKHQVEHLSIFYEVGKALFSTLDLQKILQTIMEKISDLLQPDTWALLMVDEQAQELYFEIAIGRGAEKLKDVRLKLGEGIAGWVAAHGEPVLVKDVLRDNRFTPRIDELTQPDARSVLCVPIKGREQLLGVIELVNCFGKQVFLEKHIPILRSLADYAAIALENARYVQHIHELTIKDDCTSLYNARHLNFVLDAEIYRSIRYGYEFSVIFFDLDYFKQVNDLYGHLVGSKLLWMIGDLLKSNLRLIDYAFRYGGDEFVVLLPQTSKEDALSVARRIKGLLTSKVFFNEENLNIKVTASFGIATFPGDGRTRREILRMADEAMYLIKNTTRDNIALVGEGKVPGAVLEKTVERTLDNLRSWEESRKTRQELQRAASDLATLNNIGVALSTQRDTDALLELILSKSRDVTCCDAGSLYVVEEDAEGGKHLVFKLTQNDSQAAPFRQFTLPIDADSIAGYAAATGRVLNVEDAYKIRNAHFHLNREFDRKFGYRTKSMLVVPMKNHKNEVIGVLQLINAKKHCAAKLTSLQMVQQEVIPFSKRSQDLAASLASQAGVVLENNLLYRDIQKLFEGFVKASVTAIELRDPTTLGHSERVAKLTVSLAEAVDRTDTGPYKDVHFTRQDIQELRYASVLHDFGKVGVREEVLVKAKKLKTRQKEIIENRFNYFKKALELEGTRKKLEFVLRNGNQNCEEFFSQIDEEYQKEFKNLEEFLKNIVQANEPTGSPVQTSEKLAQIAQWTFPGSSGPSEPLLTAEELRFLSIPKGSLDEEERLEIESHIEHSFRFLSQIPWTKELKNIPNIVRAHHEKLDGSGYPFRMKAEEIPLQSKMMTISDIFDALTSHDRPYQPALSIERALAIMGQEVGSQVLDPTLFKLFVDAGVYQITSAD